MRVFLSWSGAKSRAAAAAFRDWLPCVLQNTKPWMSETDIGAGSRWSAEVSRELQEATFGVLFITRDNLTAPWLIFEAGALSKSIERDLVCPYLLDLMPTDVTGPIGQFQMKGAHKDGTYELIKSLNYALGVGKGLEERTLEKVFASMWIDLEQVLKRLATLPSPSPTPLRSSDEMIAEVLSEVRGLRTAGTSSTEFGAVLAAIFDIKNEIYQMRTPSVSVEALRQQYLKKLGVVGKLLDEQIEDESLTSEHKTKAVLLRDQMDRVLAEDEDVSLSMYSSLIRDVELLIEKIKLDRRSTRFTSDWRK